MLTGNVAHNTAEQIRNHSARQQAADLAATNTTQDALNETPTDNNDAKRINHRAQRRCQHIAIIYTDVLNTTHYKNGKHSGTGWDPHVLPECTIVPR